MNKNRHAVQKTFKYLFLLKALNFELSLVLVQVIFTNL